MVFWECLGLQCPSQKSYACASQLYNNMSSLSSLNPLCANIKLFLNECLCDKSKKYNRQKTTHSVFYRTTMCIFTFIFQLSLWIQLLHHVLSAFLIGNIFLSVGNDAETPIVNFKFCLCCLVFFMYTYVMIPVLLCEYLFYIIAHLQQDRLRLTVKYFQTNMYLMWKQLRV
jgi:hypothetical protein